MNMKVGSSRPLICNRLGFSEKPYWTTCKFRISKMSNTLAYLSTVNYREKSLMILDSGPDLALAFRFRCYTTFYSHNL
jgi:hypothetical protein